MRAHPDGRGHDGLARTRPVGISDGCGCRPGSLSCRRRRRPGPSARIIGRRGPRPAPGRTCPPPSTSDPPTPVELPLLLSTGPMLHRNNNHRHKDRHRHRHRHRIGQHGHSFVWVGARGGCRLPQRQTVSGRTASIPSCRTTTRPRSRPTPQKIMGIAGLANGDDKGQNQPSPRHASSCHEPGPPSPAPVPRRATTTTTTPTPTSVAVPASPMTVHVQPTQGGACKRVNMQTAAGDWVAAATRDAILTMRLQIRQHVFRLASGVLQVR